MKVSRSATCLMWLFLTCLLTVVNPPHLQAQLVRIGYDTIASTYSGQCIVSLNSSTASGAAMVEASCNPATDTQASNMKWTLKPVAQGFEVVKQQDGLCLAVADASKLPLANIHQSICSGAAGQVWTIAASGSSYQLVNANSGLCLAEVGLPPVTTTLKQTACTPASASTLWAFSSGIAMPTAPVNLLQASSGECLNNQSSKNAGGAIVQYPCAGAVGTTAEQWLLEPYQSWYLVKSALSGLCLSVGGAKEEPAGSAVVQTTCTNANKQLWQMKAVGAVYQLSVVNAVNQCLTNVGASLNSSAPMVLATCAQAQDQLWAVNTANVPSKWSAVIPLPIIPIGSANLPDGNLITWSADKLTSFDGDVGKTPSQTYTAVYNPTTQTAVESIETNLLTNMFCPGTAQLADGRILLDGGASSYETSIYDPSKSAWVADKLLNIPRGYEGSVVLSNGSVFTIGGSFDGGTGGKTAEIWTEGQGWTVLTDIPETPIIGPDPEGTYRGDNHAWLFAVGDGQVFHAGPSAQMHWITTTGAGTITSLGNRADDSYSINGKAVMFDVGKILKAGGAVAYDSGPAMASAYEMDLNSIDTNQGITTTKLAPMAYPRTFANGVLLPTGEVVIIGGQTQSLRFSDEYGVLVPEIWDPNTKIFRQYSPMATARNYHSSAILLMDGTVFAAGGGQCSAGCAGNHFNAEILTPPYLLTPTGALATRPQITSSPATGLLGSNITVTTDSPVTLFSLVRFSSVTHDVNSDQRRLPLTITSNPALGTYVLSIPTDPGVAVPGNYMLFALNAEGVPSVAQVINLQP